MHVLSTALHQRHQYLNSKSDKKMHGQHYLQPMHTIRTINKIAPYSNMIATSVTQEID
jgi:hypothetical protein